MTNKKKAFPQPELIIHGSVEKLTQGNANGAATDANFPTGTPRGDVTFS